MIRSLYRTPAGDLQTDLSVEGLTTVVEDSEGLLWLDFCNEPLESCEPILRQVFKFHPLAIEDALEERHVPRVDDWQAYLYLVLHAISFDPQAEDPLPTGELDIFLGPNYLVTHRTEPIASVDRLWEISDRDARHLQNSAGYLLYRLVDELVSQYMPVVEEIDDTIDTIEDQVFGNPNPSTPQEIFAVRRALLRLRRIVGPEREVFNKLARGDFAVVSSENQLFFRDIYDHLVRLYEISEGLRDLAGSALDTYLSVVSNRMNEVMKVLAIITTLFMPLSFLAGFFGMNFFEPTVPLEAWTNPTAFALMLAAMIVSPIAMVIWMTRRGWM
jgi:magnesium transporter